MKIVNQIIDIKLSVEFLRIHMMYTRTNVYYFLKRMDISKSKSSCRLSNLIDQEVAVPSLLIIVHDEIETVIPSESNEHLRLKKSKTSSC
jgi:hypothetical protein